MLSKQGKIAFLSVASNSSKPASEILGFAALNCFAWVRLEASESWQ